MLAPTLQAAYVLHRRRYRESSLIVELFTAQHGRYGVLAKGALSNKWRGQLEPFQALLVDWRGRGDLPTMTHAESAGGIQALQGRPLYCGLYLNELLMRLTQRNDPHPQLFSAYSLLIGDLTQLSAQDIEPHLRYFELNLLKELGFGLNLLSDQEGHPFEPEARYLLDHESGFRRAGTQHGVSGKTLLDLNAESLADDVEERREARDLLRSILAHHLGSEPLKSRELFRR